MTWTTLAPVPGGHYWGEGGMCAWGGKLYAFSYRLWSTTPWMAVYDIATDAWTVTEVSPLPVDGTYGLGNIDVVTVDDTLWLIGVSDGGVTFITLDPATLTFGSPIYLDPALDFILRSDSSTVLVGRTIYANGVNSANTLTRCLTFNVDTHAAGLTATSAHGTTYRSICTDGITIFGVEGYQGGWGGIIQPTGQSDTGVIEFYDVATDAWTFSTHTDPHFRNDCQSAYSTDGTVWAIGGGSDDGLGPGGDYCVDWVSSYNIAADTWTVEEPLDQPRGEPLVAHYRDVLYVLGGFGNSNDPGQSLISRPLAGGAEAAQVFSLPFDDLFDRDDADTLGAPWDGTLHVISGHAGMPTTDTGSSSVDFGVADTVISVQAVTTSGAFSGSSWLAFREAEDGSYWRVRANQLEYVAADASVTGFTLTSGVSAGDTIRVYLRDTLISVYINGGKVLSIRDSRNVTASVSRLFVGAENDRFGGYHMAASRAVVSSSELARQTLVQFAPNA